MLQLNSDAFAELVLLSVFADAFFCCLSVLDAALIVNRRISSHLELLTMSWMECAIHLALIKKS